MPFLLTLLASLIGGLGFICYKHPTIGQKLCFNGFLTCMLIFIFIQIFIDGYNKGALEYYKLDKKNENLQIVNKMFSENISNAQIIIGITCLCFIALYILSITVFDEINKKANNKYE